VSFEEIGSDGTPRQTSVPYGLEMETTVAALMDLTQAIVRHRIIIIASDYLFAWPAVIALVERA
jgi:hypothetical protein